MKSFLRVWLGIAIISIGLGIGLLIVAVCSGVRWEDAWNEQSTFTTMEQSYEGVEKLDLNISYGEVKIVSGNNFSISAENIVEDELNSNVENGVWYIKEDDTKYSKFFGISFPVRKFFSFGDHFTPKITVTLPEGFTADSIILKVGAGTLDADSINSETGEFTVDAGKMQINELSVAKESTYNVGAGEMVIKEANIGNIIVDCGVGNVEIDGSVYGDNNIKSGVGKVDLSLQGSVEEYSYDISCGIGDIDIDGDSYHNINGKVIDNNSADNRLNLNCGIGNISVDFK